MPHKINQWLTMVPAVLALACGRAWAAWDLNMPRGVTEIGSQTYALHMRIIWICVGIGVVVFGTLLWSLIKYRHSKGAKPAAFHESTTVEVIWTIIPFIVLISMAIPATGVLTQVYDPGESELDVRITGYQWRWRYQYLDDEPRAPEVAYFSNLASSREQIYNQTTKGENYLLEVDEPLVIPVNKKVRFLLTSADVIHSWWVPEFTVKRDAIPGFINEAWVIAEETGTFRGQCTELCGRDHGFMPIVVQVVEQAEFDAWYTHKQKAAAKAAKLTSREWTLEDLAARGETVYTTFCMACHQANGRGLPPAFPPLDGSPVALGPIEDHIDVVLNGVTGTAMAAFGGQLDPVDLAAVITYERNAWSNHTGDMVTPVEILEMQRQSQ